MMRPFPLSGGESPVIFLGHEEFHWVICSSRKQIALQFVRAAGSPLIPRLEERSTIFRAMRAVTEHQDCCVCDDTASFPQPMIAVRSCSYSGEQFWSYLIPQLWRSLTHLARYPLARNPTL